jgi:UPF0755 protein
MTLLGPNLYDVPVHRRVIAVLALLIFAVCICVLLYLLWPRQSQTMSALALHSADAAAERVVPVALSPAAPQTKPPARSLLSPTPDPKAAGPLAGPTATPLPRPAVRSVVGPSANLKVFGELAQIVDPKAPSAADLGKRLSGEGAGRQAHEALLGPTGTLSTGTNVKSLADIGAVVEGVNDQLPLDPVATNDSGVKGPIQSYPLSPSALAEQQSRAALYGAQGVVAKSDTKVATSAPMGTAQSNHPTGARSRAFDASEGTRLDPLLNTTYDLNYPKTVPSFK